MQCLQLFYLRIFLIYHKTSPTLHDSLVYHSSIYKVWVNNFASLCRCTPAGRASDFMAPDALALDGPNVV